MKRNNLTSQIALVFCSASLFCSAQAFADPSKTQDGDFKHISGTTFRLDSNNSLVPQGIHTYTRYTGAIRLGKDYLFNTRNKTTLRSELPTGDVRYQADDNYGVLIADASPVSYIENCTGSGCPVTISVEKGKCVSTGISISGSVGVDLAGFSESVSTEVTNNVEYCTTAASSRTCNFVYDASTTPVYGYASGVYGIQYRNALLTIGGDRIYFSKRMIALLNKQAISGSGALTAIELDEVKAAYTLAKQLGSTHSLFSYFRDAVRGDGYVKITTDSLRYEALTSIARYPRYVCAKVTNADYIKEKAFMLRGNFYDSGSAR